MLTGLEDCWTQLLSLSIAHTCGYMSEHILYSVMERKREGKNCWLGGGVYCCHRQCLYFPAYTLFYGQLTRLLDGQKADFWSFAKMSIFFIHFSCSHSSLTKVPALNHKRQENKFSLLLGVRHSDQSHSAPVKFK